MSWKPETRDIDSTALSSGRDTEDAGVALCVNVDNQAVATICNNSPVEVVGPVANHPLAAAAGHNNCKNHEKEQQSLFHHTSWGNQAFIQLPSDL